MLKYRKIVKFLIDVIDDKCCALLSHTISVVCSLQVRGHSANSYNLSDVGFCDVIFGF